MNRISAKKIVPVLMLVLLFVAACSSAAPVTQTAVEPQRGNADSLPAPTSQVVGEASPTDASADPAPTEQVIRPTPRPDLHASDPSTVSLASGQVQLVEFFAFW